MPGTPPTLFARLATWVLGHARTVVLSTAALVLLAAAGLLQLRLDFSSTSFYGTNSEELAALERFTQRWGADDRDLLVVVTVDDDDGVLTTPRLRAIQHLAEALRADPNVEETIALPDLRPDPAGPTLLEGLESLTVPGLDDLGRRALTEDPRVTPALLSADGRRSVVIARLTHSTDDLGATVQTVERLEAIAASSADGLEVDFAGVPGIRAAFFRLTIRDQMIFVPLTIALVGVVLLATYRSLEAIVVPAVAAGLPLLLLLGLMGWTGQPIGLLNQAYFTLLPVIAIADAIHLVESSHEQWRRPGRSVREAVAAASAHIGWACLLTSVTTGVGFGSLAISDLPVLRGFGIYAAVGIALAYAVTLSVCPWVLVLLLQRRSGPPPAPRTAGGLGRLVGWLSGHRGWVVAGFVVAGALAGLGAREVRVDNRLTDLLRPDHPVAQASAVVDADLGGVLSLELDARGDGPLDARQRAAVESLAVWARAQPETRAVVGPRWDGDAARLSVRTGDAGGRAFAQLEQRARAAAADAVAGTGLQLHVTGTVAVAYQGVNRITADLRRSLVMVFAIVTVLIGALLRSVRLGLVCIVPNVFPLAVGYGLVGWSGLPLDPLATVILAVALGIAVDDTIHIAARFHRERAEGHAPVEATRRALETTGRAVVITSVTLMVGLTVDLGSSFPPLQMLGGLGAAVIGLALAADLLLLPVLLMGRRGRASTRPG